MAPDEPDRDVLKSLPRTRPQRRSAKRDAGRGKAADTTKAKAKPVAKATAKTRAKPATKPRSGPKRGPDRPRRMPPAGFQPPRTTEDQKPPSGAELIGTAIQAAAELAQIGLAVGGHAVRRALDRLPKP